MEYYNTIDLYLMHLSVKNIFSNGHKDVTMLKQIMVWLTL